MAHIPTSDDLRVRAIIGRMHVPRKGGMTDEEHRLFLASFRRAYERFADRQRARGVVPWSKAKYYHRWWTCQKATFVREAKQRAKEFVRGAA